MKKTLLFAFALLFATATMAQNRAVLLQETFDGATMPAGWSISGQNNNWSVSGTNNAGGQPNEMHLSWSPQFNGMTRLVSPAVDLSGVTSVAFSFKHALDNYSGANSIGVATTADGGTTWNQAWTAAFSTSGVWAETVQITTPDMGQANVQFCIYFNGSSYNINDWFFDDIKVFTLENLDLGIEGATLAEIGGSGSTSFGITVFNYSVSTVTSVEASYQVEGMEPVTETFTANIPSLGTSTLNFATPTMMVPGNYNVNYSINLVNGQSDDDESNNSFSKVVRIAYGAVERKPMIEHFSSSTCGPCVAPNNQMLTFCNNNPGRFTYTKYQMNWPGNGDPYYTEEGGVRRNYYSVNAVPMAFLDGESLNFSGVQNQFNQHADIPSFMDIRGSFTVEGNTISVIADVMSFVDVNARVYVSVNEKETHGNVGSNGETSFHHIFMKMLPNAQGTTVDFKAGDVERLEFTQDMSGTHVEEMSDLEVSIWVQSYNTKEMFNSRFAYEYTEAHPYPVENLTFALDNEADCYCLNANWDAPAQGNPVGYNVYINNELVAENITDTQYSYTGNPDEFYVVGVTALYADDQSSVRAVAAASTNMQDAGLVVYGEAEALMDENQPIVELSVMNANDGTQNAIVITAIEEENETGEPYLLITPSNELPYTLNYANSFSFTVEPIQTREAKSTAQTVVKVVSETGIVEFLITIDGELLNITELPSATRLFPNPASSTIRIEAANSIESVSVYNMMGALVETVSANSYSVNMNLSQYSNGVYFFSIRQSDGSVSNQRVVVSH